VIIFGSFVLADFLNSLFDSKYLGFLIIAVLYVLAIVILIVIMKKSERPLFTNLYIKYILPLLNIEINQNPDVEGLRVEESIVKERIENEKKILNAHTQLFKYVVFEDLLKVVGGMFTSKVNPGQKQKTTVKKETQSKNN
jgi:hypothetical protein